MNRSVRILNTIEEMFPNAKTELYYNNVFELAIAVILSAQTTDVAVNKLTPVLFEEYPDAKALAKANHKDVEAILKSIGLYRNKAKNIIEFSNQIVNDFNNQVPNTKKELITLAGVGVKTANVILSEYFKLPAIAVDTHVERVTKRLKIVRESYSVLQTEKRLERALPRERWSQAHHSFILFGRYHCTARSPKCDVCPLTADCKYYTQNVKNK
ncbi:MAG: endonuclease III [Erysipelothrix sp.]|nr:endonuclease III [Erysipelothrix sp.]